MTVDDNIYYYTSNGYWPIRSLHLHDILREYTLFGRAISDYIPAYGPQAISP